MFRLLIVDDNISDREGLRDLVDWKSMDIDRIELAKNGLEGFQKAIEFKPSLVLADVAMPVLDGLKMANKILEIQPETKFIFMSCYDDVEYIREAMDYSAYGYLLKPVDINKLVELVEKILEIKRNENEIINNVIRLENKVIQDAPYVREIITRDIVYGNIGKEYISQLEDVGLGVKKYFSIIAVSIEENSNLFAEQVYRAVYDIEKCMSDMVTEDIRISTFVQSKQLLGMIIYFDNAETEQDCMNQLFDYLTRTKNYINAKLGNNIVMCLTEIASDINKAPQMYSNIEYMLKNSIYEMGNSIVVAEKGVIEDSGFDYDIMLLKQQITEMFSDESFDDLKKFLNNHYDTTTHSKNTVKAFTYTLISILQLVLLEQNENFENVFGDNISIWTKLTSYNTILDIRQWIINIFEFVYKYLNEKNTKKDKYALIVKQIKTIIEEDYGNIKNVNQICNRIYISPNYANSIFKKIEGVTIFEYLLNTRMEKAKELLLKDADMKISEISEKVGYANKSYFAVAFREYTGKTPKQFKLQK